MKLNPKDLEMLLSEDEDEQERMEAAFVQERLEERRRKLAARELRREKKEIQE